MPILLKACRISPQDGPNDGASGARDTVSPSRREGLFDRPLLDSHNFLLGGLILASRWL